MRAISLFKSSYNENCWLWGLWIIRSNRDCWCCSKCVASPECHFSKLWTLEKKSERKKLHFNLYFNTAEISGTDILGGWKLKYFLSNSIYLDSFFRPSFHLFDFNRNLCEAIISLLSNLKQTNTTKSYSALVFIFRCLCFLLSLFLFVVLVFF